MVKNELTVKHWSNVEGGNGTPVFRMLLDDDELPKNARIMAIAEFEPGESIGYHQHVNESELYYILEGESTYQDDGEEYIVKAGTSTFCYEGHYHGIINTSDKKMKMLAVVLKENTDK